MQYQVLARKWRPQNFRDLVGQEHVSRTLLNALQTARVAHAFLFSGPRGSGKTTTARILAKAVNCHSGQPAEPCGKCVACTEIAAGNCMDVLEMDAASNRGIDEIRDLIENVRYNPARDKNKIFIIDEVHMLTEPAFNALLKTLEEPPAHVIFILATTEYHKIPVTILSRCQQYNFKLIPLPLILDRLKEIASAEKIQISQTALEQIAFSSGGSMRDALSALDQVIAFCGDGVRDEDVTMLLGLVEPAVLGEAVRAIARNDTDKILKLVGSLVEEGQDLQNFCRRLLGQFRNLMVLKAGVSDPGVLGVPESFVADLREQAELFTSEDLLRLFDALLQTEADLKYSTQTRFQLEMGLLELAQLPSVRSLEELIAEFSAMVSGQTPRATNTPSPKHSSPQASRAISSEESSSPRSGDHAAKDESSLTRSLQNPTRVGTGPRRDVPSPTIVFPEPSAGQIGSRELLEKIASAVNKESLEIILQAVPGAELKENVVILNLAPVKEFFRRQIKENLPLIAHAASVVVGRPVALAFAGEEALASSGPATVDEARPALSPEEDILKRAKREPVVQSFLEVFPGPVRAEDIES